MPNEGKGAGVGAVYQIRVREHGVGAVCQMRVREQGSVLCAK